MTATGTSKAPVAFRRAARFVAVAMQRFYADGCLLHASALTYSALLSLVPLLALMFAVLKGLGVQRRLEPLLLSRLSLDADVTQRIIAYIDHTNVGTLGALGAVALIGTVFSVFGNIEKASTTFGACGTGARGGASSPTT